MAEFRGYRCDSCGQTLDADERNRKRVIFEGPDLDGEYTEDLCGECVSLPGQVTLRPRRSRAGKVEGEQIPSPEILPSRDSLV